MAMRLLDLFSGIGGFSYAAEKLIGGYETVAFCEMDEFCQKVLKKHWPQVPIFDDVRTIDAARLGRIDICTFGFPCQPVSQAGLQKAESDDRWLWDEIIRILQASKPKWIIAENVKGLVSVEDGLLLQNCITSLEAEGYEIQSVIIPACAKNAPHKRDRIWIIGQLTTNTYKWQSRSGDESKSDETQQFKFSTDNTSERGIVANTTSKGKWEITRGLGESQKEMGEKRSEFTTRSDTSSTETRTNVANTSSKGSQRGLHRGQVQRRQTEQQYFGHTSTIREQPKERAETVVGKLGDMVDGISRGLLRHFDREPDHIPRVTKGEKDRAKKLKALGNSIVPQVAAEILLAIRVSEESD